MDIDEFVYDVLRKCNDADIEICEAFGRIKTMIRYPKRAIEKQIKEVLNGKNVTFTTPNNEDYRCLVQAIISENAKKAFEEGEDPF